MREYKSENSMIGMIAAIRTCKKVFSASLREGFLKEDTSLLGQGKNSPGKRVALMIKSLEVKQ